jgi:hypothetical protein
MIAVDETGLSGPFVRWYINQPNIAAGLGTGTSTGASLAGWIIREASGGSQ